MIDLVNKTVTLSLEYYSKLVEDSLLLDALHAAGVDNWEGYSEAVREVVGEESVEDI